MNKIVLTLVCNGDLSMKRMHELGAMMTKRMHGNVVEMTDQKLLELGELLVANYGVVLSVAPQRAQEKRQVKNGNPTKRSASNRRRDEADPSTDA